VAEADWDAPRTEEGLQQVLSRLTACRAAGDLEETGNGLLELSYLVKWVRSDTEQPPFVRSHELALEALAIFRRAGHERAQVRSLVAASALANPRAREEMLAEGESLAQKLGDQNLIAMVLAARARSIALSDSAKAAELHRPVLEIYRRTGNLKGQANCLLSLAITGDEGPAEKRDFATKAANLFRDAEDPKEASLCVSVALWNAEEIQPLTELEDLARQGLEDALNAGDRLQEGHFYGKLALIAVAKSQIEEADKFRRWAKDLQDADGMTPLQRWEDEVATTKQMAEIAKSQGNVAAAKVFRDELKRLKASKPA
jgi:hypothetical protein